MVLIWARFSCPLLSSWWIRDPEFISTFHPENHFLLVKDEFFFESLPNSLPLTACLSNISFLSFFSSCRSCGREHGVINFLLSLTYSIMDLSNDKKEVLSCWRSLDCYLLSVFSSVEISTAITFPIFISSNVMVTTCHRKPMEGWPWTGESFSEFYRQSRNFWHSLSLVLNVGM